MLDHKLFLLFSIFLTALIFESHVAFKNYFKGYDLMEKKVKILSLREQQSELKQKIAEYQLRSFKQEVAAILPDHIENSDFKESKYPLRTLSSVVRKATENIDVAMGKSQFVAAKAKFNGREYDQAIALLKNFIDMHSYSVHVVEAQFLLAEAYYQVNDLDLAVETIESMIKVFPENDLTGLALLRFGKILEIQDRTDEAQIIYQTVLQSFTHPKVVKQAKRSLSSI